MDSTLLKEWREAFNGTQREIALKLGVTDKTVWNWETGKTSPDLAIAGKVADAYRVSRGQVEKLIVAIARTKEEQTAGAK